jgi:hypothetical protein
MHSGNVCTLPLSSVTLHCSTWASCKGWGTLTKFYTEVFDALYPICKDCLFLVEGAGQVRLPCRHACVQSPFVSVPSMHAQSAVVAEHCRRPARRRAGPTMVTASPPTQQSLRRFVATSPARGETCTSNWCP